MKTVITSIFLCFNLIIIAQSNLVTFEYDAAGNRVKRHANLSCEEEKTHTEPFTINHSTYQASNYIESTLFVSASDTLNYKAGEFILLNNGFKVENDATFEAIIESCEEEVE